MASGGRSMRMSTLPLSSALLMKPSLLASSTMVTARPCRLLVSTLALSWPGRVLLPAGSRITASTVKVLPWAVGGTLSET